MGSSKLENLLGGRWQAPPEQEKSAPRPTPTPAPDRPVVANAARPAPQPATAVAPPCMDPERRRTGANSGEQGRTPTDDVDSADVEREVTVTIRAQALGGELLQVVLDPDYWKEQRAEIAAAPGVPYFVDELVPLLELPLEAFRLLHEVKKRTGGTVIPEDHPQHAHHQAIFRQLGGDGPVAGSPEAIRAERRAKGWFPYAGQEKDLEKDIDSKKKEDNEKAEGGVI